MDNNYTPEQPIERRASVMTNPIIRKLSKVTETDSAHVSTYGGIVGKTIFFLLLTAFGAVLAYYLHGHFTDRIGDDLPFAPQELLIVVIAGVFALFTPLLAWLIRPTIPVTGSLYAMSQGYLLAFVAMVYGGEYVRLMWLALALTLLIVFVMLVLYASRIVKVNHKFNAVLKILFFTAILGSIGLFIGSLIPFTSHFVTEIMSNPVISIGGSVLMIVIASLFLLSDFDVIERTVEHQLPKKYEWIAAFGLVFTVIWLYLKVLNLLVKLTNRKN